MKYLTITDEKNTIKLEDKNCINLELIFNKTEYGKKWIFIGDHLYYFVYNDKNHPVTNILKVTTEQYKFLEKLIYNNRIIKLDN